MLLRTPTDIFPAINIPVVAAVWTYNGLSAQEIEQRIVYNHERMITAIVDNIEHIESTAYTGVGVIKVFLRPGASVDTGVAQITATGQAILRSLPPGIAPPIIVRYNASTVPILQYSFASKKFSESELQDMAFNQVRVGLTNVPGASMPYPYGGKVRVVAVDLDLAAVKARNLAPQDVVNALNAQNLILPSGTAKIGPTEYDVALNSNPTVIEELNDLPVRTVGAPAEGRMVGRVRRCGTEPVRDRGSVRQPGPASGRGPLRAGPRQHRRRALRPLPPPHRRRHGRPAARLGESAGWRQAGPDVRLVLGAVRPQLRAGPLGPRPPPRRIGPGGGRGRCGGPRVGAPRGARRDRRGLLHAASAGRRA